MLTPSAHIMNASLLATADPNFIDPVKPMLIVAIYLFLIMIPIVLILFFFFYKKKLQHQQILAAIEKGHPIEDLLAKPAKQEQGWLANISAGVGLIFVAIALLILYAPAGVYIAHNLPRNSLVVIPIILIGLSITRLIRGIYQKKEADKAGGQSAGGRDDMAPNVSV